MYQLFFEKLKDNSIKDIPVEILHELSNFFNANEDNDIESIARYNKLMSDVDKNQAETYRTFAEGKTKMADSEKTNLENQEKEFNMKFNQKDNHK